jgi:isopropylmalate/homocitrate/citramalate synthase
VKNLMASSIARSSGRKTIPWKQGPPHEGGKGEGMNMASHRDKVWASEFNNTEQIRNAFSRSSVVRFYDTTLRDGEQTNGVVLSPEDKLQIARKLDELGVARIEAGFPRVSEEDAEAIRLILNAGLKSEIWGFSRALRADVEAMVKLQLRYALIEAPTSDIKLKAWSIQPEEVLRRITEAVRFATDAGMYVAYFAVDATRTKAEFLKRAYGAALEAGARELAIVDTIGVCVPEAVEALVRQVRSWFGDSVPLHWHGHNDFGLATSSAVAAVRGGAEWVQGTINGMGERAGNTNIGEVAAALSLLYEVPVELNLTKIREVSQLVRQISGCQLEPWKPVVGDNLFVRESGGVVAQFHIPAAIEPYAAELVGATRGVQLGKKSGIDSIDIKCRELGINLPSELRPSLLAAVKKVSVRKRGVLTDSEFRELVAQSCGQVRGEATQQK